MIISRTNVASVGSVFNDTRKVKVLSLPETIKEKSTFRAKALRREGPSLETSIFPLSFQVVRKHENSGILLLGDFNKLNVANLKSSYRLKQIVKFATRGANTLDLVLTNLQDFYDSPDRLPPFGLSDHMSIQVRPKSRVDLPKGRFVIKSRDLRPSKCLAMRTYLQQVNIPGFTNSV